jgi:hypothetical protein
MLTRLINPACHLLVVCLLAGFGLSQDAFSQYVPAGGEFSSQVVPSMNGVATDFSPHRAGLSALADLRIPIGSAAVYRITQPQLVASGIDSNQLMGDHIRLFCRTQEVAIQVSNSGLWTTNDSLMFYGAPHPGYYTTTNVYWLGVSGGSRLAIPILDGATNSGGIRVTSYWERVSYGPDLLWRDFYRPWDDTIDHWFAALVTHTADTPTFVTLDDRIAAGNATLNLLMYGLTSGSHTTRVYINGNSVFSFAYTGAERFSTSSQFSVSFLLNGANTFTFRQTNAPLDSAYVTEYSVDYLRSLKARNDTLNFNGLAGTNLYQILGFSTNMGFRVLDVSDPVMPQLFTNWSITGGPASFVLNFRSVSTIPRRYCVSTDARIGAVSGLHRYFFRNLATTNNQADYLMVTPYDLRRPAYDLLKHRQTNGLAVKAIPLDDLYNEFSYGIVDAAAIKQFIGYAYYQWKKPAPRFVCLVGEGTPDPRNGLGLNSVLTLPVHYGPSSFNWCAQDNWYACVDGSDWLADLSIGRIPVSTTTEFARVVAKTRSFETNVPPLDALLVADRTDTNPPPLNFKTTSDTIIWPPLDLAGYFDPPLTAYYDDDPVAQNIRFWISSGINAGVHLVTYFGHGSADLWSDKNFWNTNDIPGLTNSRYPIVAIFSCENGAYDDLSKKCLAEVFVKDTHGAVACVAPTVLSVQEYAEKIAAGFMGEFTNKTTRLGDSMNAGLLNLWHWNDTAYELMCYEIFGDPALEKY